MSFIDPISYRIPGNIILATVGSQPGVLLPTSHETVVYCQLYDICTLMTGPSKYQAHLDILAGRFSNQTL